jgi:hypothetical protein
VLTGDTRLADPRNFDASANSAPRIGLCATPDWSLADEDTQQAWAQAEKALTGFAQHLALPAGLQGLVARQKAVQAFETARSLRHEHRHHTAQLSAPLLALLEEGMRISGEIHAHNLQAVAHQRQVAADLFRDHDVLLAPSAIGEAPTGLETTGDPLFCRAFTCLLRAAARACRLACKWWGALLTTTACWPRHIGCTSD